MRLIVKNKEEIALKKNGFKPKKRRFLSNLILFEFKKERNKLILDYATVLISLGKETVQGKENEIIAIASPVRFVRVQIKETKQLLKIQNNTITMLDNEKNQNQKRLKAFADNTYRELILKV